jgi:hypothetical protein
MRETAAAAAAKTTTIVFVCVCKLLTSYYYYLRVVDKEKSERKKKRRKNGATASAISFQKMKLNQLIIHYTHDDIMTYVVCIICTTRIIFFVCVCFFSFLLVSFAPDMTYTLFPIRIFFFFFLQNK